MRLFERTSRLHSETASNEASSQASNETSSQESNETSSQAVVCKAAEYGSFFSDAEKNESFGHDMHDGLDPLFDQMAANNLSKSNAEEHRPTTANELEGKSEERKVKFDVQINRPNNFKPQEITFEDIDKYYFTKVFIEFILTEKFVHLYFDFDSISSEDEFISVIDWLESLKEVFGPYTYGGYANDESMSKDYEFRYFPEGKHFLSMHAIFYSTCISTSDLQAIMKHTEKNGFSTKGVHEKCDPNVYKLVPRSGKDGSRQLFRHVLSDKIGCKEPSKNHGTLIDNAKPSDHIVQIRGNEPIIYKDKWSEIFTLADALQAKNADINASNIKSNIGW